MSVERATVRVLLVPADELRCCAVLVVPDAAAPFSDAIGGGLLEEIHHDMAAGRRYCVYGDEEREAKSLPANTRAVVLVAQLGWVDHTARLGLRGDLLFVGADMPSRDTDVPPGVLDAATRSGFLPGLHPTGYRPSCWYLASVASFCGFHHHSLCRYHSMVAASPDRQSP
ncbi:MAG: hypothetical protein HYR62_07790 [Actinobacteria bacterium]|nr:hypothetical protein [Actinomycetota bacterium]MBI3687587.1 hypothetical protein [Actinomycetota bacterium]